MIDFNPVKVIISNIAPILSSIIGGSSEISLTAISMISKMFGANINDPNDILSKIKSDPDKDNKLKNLEVEIAKISLKKQSIEDVENARDRQVDLAKLGISDKIPGYLALCFTFGFFIWIFFLTIFSKLQNDVVTMGLISAMTIILTYYFGSSNDKNKN